MVTWTRERHFDEAWYMTSSQVETSSNSLITHQFLNNSIMAGQGGGQLHHKFLALPKLLEKLLIKKFSSKNAKFKAEPPVKENVGGKYT